MNTYKLTLIAVFAALAIIGRYAFTFIPNVQPVTAIIIICGVLLGSGAAIILSLLVTFLSNMILGMGIWTVWQIISWALIGFIAGMIGKYVKDIHISYLILFGVFSGYLYGFIISLMTYQVTGKFWPYYLLGLPFDTYHAIGNGVFILLLYPLIKYLLKKYANGRFSLQSKS